MSPTPPVSPFAPNPDVYAIPNGQGETVLALTAADGQGVVALAPRGVINEGSVGLVANNVDGLIQCETDDTITSCSETNIAAKFLHAALPSTGPSALVTLEFESCAVESDVLDSVIAVKWNGNTVCHIYYNSEDDPIAWAYTHPLNMTNYLPQINAQDFLVMPGSDSHLKRIVIPHNGELYGLGASIGDYGVELEIDGTVAVNADPMTYLDKTLIESGRQNDLICEFESVEVKEQRQLWAIKYNGQTILNCMANAINGHLVVGSRVLCEIITDMQVRGALTDGQAVYALCNDKPLRMSGTDLSRLSVQYAGSADGHVGSVQLAGIVDRYNFVSAYTNNAESGTTSIESFLSSLDMGEQTIEYDADISPFTMTKFIDV